MSHKRIAYFVNEYPKVSHTFIRREIIALEGQGFEVLRIALRGWNTHLADPIDHTERTQTRYVLQCSLFSIVVDVFRTLVKNPYSFFSALSLALRLGFRGQRPWPYHLVYFAEACKIVPWLDEFGATHVHAHFGTNSAEVVMLATALGGPSYSFTVHGPDEFDSPQSLRLKEKARNAKFVVSISSFCTSQLYRWVDYDDWKKIHIVRCGLEQDYFNSIESEYPDERRLVCVGRLSVEKGQALLLMGLHSMVQQGKEIPQLVLVGDGAMRSQLEKLIVEFQLEEKVKITGWLSSEAVRAEIQKSQALILPSFAEGLPVVLMEAMALHRPVLTTNIAAIAELVRPSKDGWLCTPGDVDALIEALDEYLGTSCAQLKEMGRRASERVIQLHSVEQEAAKLASLI